MKKQRSWSYFGRATNYGEYFSMAYLSIAIF
jgi:hypothetical protein